MNFMEMPAAKPSHLEPKQKVEMYSAAVERKNALDSLREAFLAMNLTEEEQTEIFKVKEGNHTRDTQIFN